MRVASSPRNSCNFQRFSPISCFGYGMGSEGRSPQWDTDGQKHNLTGVTTLPYSIQNENKCFAYSSTLMAARYTYTVY